MQAFLSLERSKCGRLVSYADILHAQKNRDQHLLTAPSKHTKSNVWARSSENCQYWDLKTQQDLQGLAGTSPATYIYRKRRPKHAIYKRF